MCFFVGLFTALAQSPANLTLSGNAALTAGNGFAMNGTGTVTGLGSAVLSGAGTVDNAVLSGQKSGPILGSFTLVFQSGDVLVGNFSIPSGVLVPFIGQSTSATGFVLITAGTGKFAGVSGSFLSMTGSGTATGEASSSFSVSGPGTISVGQKILPQFAFGGGWYSALYFTNAGTAPASFVVSFTADNGTPLNVPSVGGSSKAINLDAGATAVIEAPNAGSVLQQGYAFFTLPPGVTGYGIFRQSVAGIPDQEVVVPLSGASAKSSTLIWDETSYTTAASIANPSSETVTVTVVAKNAAGNVIGAYATVLPPKNKTAVVLKTLPGLAGTAGNRGTATFTVTSGSIAVLGLRVNGSAFTSIPTVDQ
jgi:hypothetical protein